MTAVPRPALSAPEREQLTGWLDHQRSFVRMKCTGLSEEDAHRNVVPTSPLMTPAGLVAHRHVGHLDIIRELIDGRTGYTKLEETA